MTKLPSTLSHAMNMIQQMKKDTPTEHKATIQGNVPSKSNCYEIVISKGANGKYFGKLVKSSKVVKYEENFLWQVGRLRDLNIAKPFKIYIDVYYPSKRSDLDNSFKIILDCLQKVKAIKNDNNVYSIIANKFIDKEKPRVELKIVVD